MKNIVIVGATSGIAEAVARVYADKNCRLVLLGRNQEKLSEIQQDLSVRSNNAVDALSFELRDPRSFSHIVDDVKNLIDTIDVLFVAPGSLPDQSECESNTEKLLDELALNGSYTIALIQVFANAMKIQKQGSIIALSSPAGDRGRQSNYIYGAAKASLTVFMQGLRNSMFKHGVHVMTVKPGFVITPMTENFERSGPLWAKPETVAKQIVMAQEKGRDSIYAPKIWALIMLIIRNIPEFIFKRLSL